LTTSVYCPLNDQVPRPEGGWRIENLRCWNSRPAFSVCFPRILVRLSVNWTVELYSTEGRNWLLPRLLRPVKKIVPNPPFNGTWGTSWMPNLPGMLLRSLAKGWTRDVPSRLKPSRASLTSVGANECVSLTAMLMEEAVW